MEAYYQSQSDDLEPQLSLSQSDQEMMNEDTNLHKI